MVDRRRIPIQTPIADLNEKFNRADGRPLLSIIIPAYNEEDGIARIIERVLAIRSSLAGLGIDGPEIIVVDDGSRDRTAEIIAQYPDVRLISHQTNLGYGAALKTGLARANGEMVSFLDADGTYPPEHFVHLCQAILNGADLVIGTRMAGAKSEMPAIRRLGNRIFAGLVTLLGNSHVSDSASGMRVFRKDVLPKLYPLPDGLNFTPIMSMRAVHEKLNIIEVPIPYHERVGRSKLSVVRDGLRYFQSITWTAMGYNPARVLGGLGLVGIVIALIIGLGLLVARLNQVTTLEPLGVVAVFLALICGVAGVSLFNLGTTFNYLVALFRKQPVEEGVFGKPLFKARLDRQFGRIGILAALAGIGIGVFALAMGFTGWVMPRLWFYLVVSTMLILVGLQLIISWVLVRKLEELSDREMQTRNDLGGGRSTLKP